jgi:hypothetical protein
VICAQVGQWLLIVDPHSIQRMMMKVIAGQSTDHFDGGKPPRLVRPHKNKASMPGFVDLGIVIDDDPKIDQGREQ